MEREREGFARALEVTGIRLLSQLSVNQPDVLVVLSYFFSTIFPTLKVHVGVPFMGSCSVELVRDREK